MNRSLELLAELQQIPGPSGDEGAVADRVEQLAREVPGVRINRTGDLLLAVRGKPRVAVLAHMDTVGFTQAHRRLLYGIGTPEPAGGEELRETRTGAVARLERGFGERGPTWRLKGRKGEPGSRWVFAAPLRVRKDRVLGPYLDNRAGVWNGLRVLGRCTDVAVAFTVGEEHSGRGAAIAGRMLSTGLRIHRALISDITWHTRSVRCGRGPVVSLRDRSLPRQRFLDRVLEIARGSGVPFQVEVQQEGGSDGSILDRSGYPVDWVFVGAPQKRPHTAREECRISDLEGMTALHCALVEGLSR